MSWKDGDELPVVSVGFGVVVPAAELRAHLGTRASHHRQRAAELEAKVAALRDKKGAGLEDAIGAALGIGGATLGAYGPVGMHGPHVVEQVVQGIEQSVARHRVAAQAFEFFRDHLEGRDHRLSVDECSRLELIDQDSNLVTPAFYSMRRGLVG